MVGLKIGRGVVAVGVVPGQPGLWLRQSLVLQKRSQWALLAPAGLLAILVLAEWPGATVASALI